MCHRMERPQGTVAGFSHISIFQAWICHMQAECLCCCSRRSQCAWDVTSFKWHLDDGAPRKWPFSENASFELWETLTVVMLLMSVNNSSLNLGRKYVNHSATWWESIHRDFNSYSFHNTREKATAVILNILLYYTYILLVHWIQHAYICNIGLTTKQKNWRKK